ncbi:MAG: ParB/RepB/Spo0J family partition protein [Rhizobiales bacterium]|nr:ParB/RepB/Spo0J family partition protein [Hyphomicrobiales bacterium]
MSATIQRTGRLGRGLASLIGEAANGPVRLPPEGEQRLVPIAQISPSPLNPRRSFPEAELEELANSIREKGLVQPLIVRPSSPGAATFEIVAGERRWRGAQIAGIHSVPVIVRELNDQEVLELAIIENVQRADLNALEEARGYGELISRYGYTQEDLAQVIGKSRSHLANTLRLLKLPDEVQSMLLSNALSAGHARQLVGRDDALELALLVVERELSVREVEKLVQAMDDTTEKPRRRRRDKDADTVSVEQELADALGLKVEIKPGGGETGVLLIRYGNFDQLDYVRKRLIRVVTD